MTTHAAPGRLVGNAVVDTDDFGQIVGFENHSGRTILGTTAPLGHVRRGHGNNGHDRTEGARHFNAIGTYLHGPILAKNPQIADFLITRTLERKLGTTITLPHIDDSLEHTAAHHAATLT